MMIYAVSRRQIYRGIWSLSRITRSQNGILFPFFPLLKIHVLKCEIIFWIKLLQATRYRSSIFVLTADASRVDKSKESHYVSYLYWVLYCSLRIKITLHLSQHDYDSENYLFWNRSASQKLIPRAQFIYKDHPMWFSKSTSENIVSKKYHATRISWGKKVYMIF